MPNYSLFNYIKAPPGKLTGIYLNMANMFHNLPLPLPFGISFPFLLFDSLICLYPQYAMFYLSFTSTTSLQMPSFDQRNPLHPWDSPCQWSLHTPSYPLLSDLLLYLLCSFLPSFPIHISGPLIPYSNAPPLLSPLCQLTTRPSHH